MMVKDIDEYLEKRGGKYFVTFTVICYVLGTFIFNIYLHALGISEFELLKLRYMFVGLAFAFVTSVFPLTFYGVKKIRGFFSAPKKSKKDDKKTHSTLGEVVLYALFIPWIWIYSQQIFPMIPSAFGGAKPEVARLLGEPETIQELNELIAYETGIDAETLPFDLAAKNSKLALGANVKILDHNKDRYILILTKDLYLSSTSNVAKELLDSGEVGSFDEGIEYGETFAAKPVYFSSKNIRGTTSTLYEPPKITTQDDLELAARVVAENPETAAAVEKVIAKDLPEEAPKFIAAVQKKVAEKKQAVSTTNEKEESVQTSEIEEIVEDSVDRVFVDFRADVFHKSSALFTQEKYGTNSPNSRAELVKLITSTFENSFKTAWGKFSGDKNYLIVGQAEKDFPRKIQQVFQGADSPETIVQRLNDLEPKKLDNFISVLAGAKLLFENSSQENNEYNRKYVSEVIVRYFNQKARQYTTYWNAPKYLSVGVTDENYLENIKDVLKNASDWEDLKTKLSAYQSALEEKNKKTETPAEEVTEETSEESSSEETPSEGTETPAQEENSGDAVSEEAPAETPETSSTDSVEENTDNRSEAPVETPAEESSNDETPAESDPVISSDESSQSDTQNNNPDNTPSQ